VLAKGWYYDSSIAAFMGGPGRKGFDAIAWFDKHIIDGAVNGVASIVRVSSDKGRTVQTGYVRNYALGLVAGAILVAGFILSKAVTG
jgi:NADH-quinone oxidoreductase subunit L